MSKNNKLLTDALAQWIGLTHKLVMRNHFSFIKSKGLSFAQMMTLRHLYHCKSTGGTELSRILEISPPAVSQLLEKMVQAGYLQRREDPEDRRHKIHLLTDSGEVLLNEFHKNIYNWAQIIEEKLPREKQESIIEVLDLLCREAQQLEKEMNQ